jgi:uracil-DNA glycosylase family 4
MAPVHARRYCYKMNLGSETAEILRWYVEAGVDAALGETPRDRLAEARAAATERAERPAERAEPRRAAPPPSAPPATAAAVPFAGAAEAADETAVAARTAARSAASLEELREALARFEGCALKNTAKNLVFSAGEPGARVMMVGEAPGADEDRIGEPFVGRSGQLLDRMLRAIGLDRSAVYIANVIPWRPPGNRTPTPQEQAACEPFIRRQIELVDPDILVCLGGPSAQTLLGIKDGILKARGRWTEYDTGKRRIRALATLHPAYLLRQPGQKKMAWRDFKALRAALATLPPKG